MGNKDKKYIKKIQIIAEADIRCGNKNKLKAKMKELMDKGWFSMDYK